MKLNQKGFGLIEGILAVIALILIFGVGFYVYSANKDEDKNDSAAETSQPISEQTEVTDETQTAEKEGQYLEFKDWGVRVPIPEGYSDIYQVKHTISVHNLDDVDDCAATGTGLAMLVRLKNGEKVEPTPGSPISDETFDGAVLVNGYQYAITSGNGTCTDPSNSKWTKARKAVLNLSASVEEIPNQ